MKRALLGLAAVLLLAGCGASVVNAITDDPTITNVSVRPRGYIIYDIPVDGVRCREHRVRSELTCWKI